MNNIPAFQLAYNLLQTYSTSVVQEHLEKFVLHACNIKFNMQTEY